MTKEEIEKTPKLVDYILSESLIAESKEKLHKRLDEICNLAIKALEQEPQIGHWELDETDNSIICDKCGCRIWANDIFRGEAHFCPNCGCRMSEVSE